MPYRPDRMDHMPGGQLVAPGDLRFSRFTAVELAALGQQLRPCCTMDGAVHATAAQQRVVGGVNDGIHHLLGDVALDDVQALVHGALLLLKDTRYTRPHKRLRNHSRQSTNTKSRKHHKMPDVASVVN